MLTMLEATHAEVPRLAEAGPEDIYYVWSIPGFAESPEVADEDDGGAWPTVEQAYADLQGYLLQGHPVLPSTAQIIVWCIYQPTVTHVVRIG